jgi:hypothetical protein
MRERETYFISTLLIYILDYTYITFSYKNVLFLNILFRYNTLLTQEKNIVNNGTIFRVFLGPDKHLQVCKRPVAVWSVISKDYLSSHQGSYML